MNILAWGKGGSREEGEFIDERLMRKASDEEELHLTEVEMMIIYGAYYTEYLLNSDPYSVLYSDMSLLCEGKALANKLGVKVVVTSVRSNTKQEYGKNNIWIEDGYIGTEQMYRKVKFVPK